LRLRGENAFLLTTFYRKDAKFAKEEQIAHAFGSVSVHFRVLPWQLLFFNLNIRWTESYLRHTFFLLSINISNKFERDQKRTFLKLVFAKPANTISILLIVYCKTGLLLRSHQALSRSKICFKYNFLKGDRHEFL